MIKNIKRILGIDCNEKKYDEKPKKQIYYKVKVKKYYGLCGFKWKYGVAMTVSHNEFAHLHEDCGGCWDILNSTLGFLTLAPKGSIEVEEDEYLSNIGI